MTQYHARMAIDSTAVRILRERSGMTVGRLAEEVSISPQYLRDIEAGRRACKRRPDLVKAIAEALDVPVPMVTARQSIPS